MRYLSLFACFWLSLVQASPPIGHHDGIRVTLRLFDGEEISNCVVTTLTGAYVIRGDGREICTLRANMYMQIKLIDGRIRLRTPDQNYGSFDRLAIEPAREPSVLRIRPVVPELFPRRFSGRFEMQKDRNALRILHDCNLETYVAGVVTAESGAGSGLEYYKSQAVICRTYAMGHLDRHRQEGFQLCDGVHCQVFNGLSYHPDIERAALTTAGEVIADKAGHELIPAAFHANCGGETAASEQAWSNADPHLRSVKDPWCAQANQAQWTLTMSVEKWVKYLKNNGFRISDSLNSDVLAFRQPSRKAYYRLGNDSISLKQVRLDLGLRSAWFTIRPARDQLVLEGRGYGHGVGLCQEGAMEMARKGKKYLDIIRFYYRNVKIRKIKPGDL